MSRRNTSSSVERRTSTVSGCEPAPVHVVDDRVAVVRADHDPVLQHLDVLADAVERGDPVLRPERSSTTSRSTKRSISVRGDPSATIFARP